MRTLQTVTFDWHGKNECQHQLMHGQYSEGNDAHTVLELLVVEGNVVLHTIGLSK